VSWAGRSSLAEGPRSDGSSRPWEVAATLDGTVPLPGSGRTWERWRELASVALIDLVAARLGEGHLDALAILAELGHGEAEVAGPLGVWAAEAPPRGVVARSTASGWVLDGRRAWCSGATSLGTALVTAHAPDGLRLFLVPLATPGVRPLADTWPAVGMAASDSLTVEFTGVALPPEAAVGQPGQYLDRPGFWHGAMGVAACWFGGAVGVARGLRDAATERPDPHRLAHLGAVDSALTAMGDVLRAAATATDADPHDLADAGERRARRVRATIEHGCDEVLAHTGRGTGAGPLGHDGDHARRVADLTVYLRQSHAEADLAALGAAVLGRADDWLAR